MVIFSLGLNLKIANLQNHHNQSPQNSELCNNSLSTIANVSSFASSSSSLDYTSSANRNSYSSSSPSSSLSSPSSMPSANYDLQIASGFTENFTSLAYNVTAVEQNDSVGYGPTYIVNGLSNQNYWYQVGLQWNEPFLGNLSGYMPGFKLSYEVWSPNDGPIFPVSGGAGALSFSGQVENGDIVLLSMNFSTNNKVVLTGYDWNTSASAKITYTAAGATEFVGNQNSQPRFTGLMTEWYNSCSNTGGLKRVVYSNNVVAINASWICIDEWNFSNVGPYQRFDAAFPNEVVFSQCSNSTLSYSDNPNELQSYSAYGVTAYTNAHQFITD